MKEKTYQAAVYLRLSREDGDVTDGGKTVSNSIANQKELVVDYLKSHPEIKVIDTYTDDGFSGVNFERPEFQRMLSDIREGKIDCVIVKDLSRFGRDYVELGDYLEQIFPFLGIRFISVNDNYDSDLEEGGLDIAFKNLVYDYYSRDLSKKERIAKTRLAELGKCGASQAMYGYRTIDRETFRERKAEYDQEIDVLRERIMAVRELMDDESDSDIDESILDKDEITDEIWEKYIESAEVFPDDRMTIKFKF